MCPRFSSEDEHLDMSMLTYGRILDSMKYAHTVDFTGWGEPLLNKNIFEMIRLARERGCATTMTSNGTALVSRNRLQLIEAGLTNLVVSVDGMRPETYDPIRIGSSFETVTNKLKALSDLINSRQASLELGIAFTIQAANASDLELILPWMLLVGAKTLHLKHVNVISQEQDWNDSFLRYVHQPKDRDERVLRDLEDRIGTLLGECVGQGIRVMMHSEFPLTDSMDGRHCLATPLNSVYFSHDGKVSPCCHFGHHVSRYFEGQFYPPSSLEFGDISIQSLEEIWVSRAFDEFRRGFREERFPEACKTCYLLYGK
jgi:MoaA/NifB/PqqE/SkfB family radical SAM enzyme